ncbi:MAG: hypothetical protein IK048_01510 [Clostridia bacterium]|nr:hypothetical protein [Clostridia bacterium]
MTKTGVKRFIVAVAVAAAIILLSGIFVGFDSKIACADGEIDVWDGSVETSWYTEHTSDPSFEISSAAQLAGLSQLSYDNELTFEGKTITLTRDIDLNGCKVFEIFENSKHKNAINFTDTAERNVWVPIRIFSGTFDGGNHTIYNMSVQDGAYAEGLGWDSGFIPMCSNGTVRNLGFANAIVSATRHAGVAVGTNDNGTIRNVTVENSQILLAQYCAGGIAGTSSSLIDCVVRGLTVNCELGGSQLIGGLVGASGPTANEPTSITLTRCEVYNFSIINAVSPTCVGLFAGNDGQDVSLTNCKANGWVGLASNSDFTVSGDESIVWQNVEQTTVNGNVVAGGGNNSYAYDATSCHGYPVVVTFVSAPYSVIIECTGADAPSYTLTGRTLSFSIPSTATDLTITAKMQQPASAEDHTYDVTATFDIGDNSGPDYTALDALLDDYMDAVEALGGNDLVATAQTLYANYLALLDGKTADELTHIASYLEDTNDYASAIVKRISSVSASTYGDTTVTATLEMIDGTTKAESATIASFTTQNSLSATVNSTQTYKQTEYVVSYVATNVQPKHITVTIDDKQSQYGDGVVALTHSVPALIEGEQNVNFITLEKAAGNAVGNYEITGEASHLGYSVDFTTGTYTIVPRQIKIVIHDLESEYGDNLSALGADLEDGYTFAYGDQMEDVIELLKVDGTAVSTYDISFNCINSNYSVTSDKLGVYTITPRAVKITIDDKNSVYGESDVPLTFSLDEGYETAYDEDVNSLVTLAREAGTGAKDYAVSIALYDPNYTVTATKNGVYTINKRPITIVIDSLTAEYGEENAPEPSAALKTGSTLATGDELTKILSLSKGTNKNVGVHTITCSDKSGNYEITLDSVATYTIKPKSISVKIDDKESYFGDSIAELTCSVKGEVELPYGDDVYDVVSLSTTSGENVGPFTITGAMKAGSEISGNYEVEFEEGTYTVLPRPISIRINDATSVYGEEDASLSAVITSGSLVGETDVTSVLTLVREKGADVGTYEIYRQLKDDINYDVKWTDGVYTITPRPITVSVSDATSVYGEALAKHTLALTQGETKDSLEDVIVVSEPDSLAAGTYEITARVKSASGKEPNYDATFVYTHDDHSIYVIEKKDASSGITANISNGASVIQGTAVNFETNIVGAKIEKTITLNGRTVENTDAVGEYSITATLADDNFFGSLTITFSTYENVLGKIEAIAEYVATYNLASASDEERIEALFSAQAIYANMSATDLMQIEANDDYQTAVNGFITCWNALREGAEKDIAVAQKAYDNTLAVVLAATSAATLLGLAVVKLILG